MGTLVTYSGFVAELMYLWSLGGIMRTRPVFRRIRLRCHVALFAMVLTLALQATDMFGNVPWWLTALNITFIPVMLYLWRYSFVLIAHFERLHRF
jgi:hypothetical protein